ncbi:MAG: AAA family ATPase [Candidatus Limnocylindrales bacterium]
MDLVALMAVAKARGLSVIAITDHNSVENARSAAALTAPDLLVIPGIEISTPEGHLLGLFAPDAVDDLEELARSDLGLQKLASGGARSRRSASELVEAIAARHGLAIMAHIDTADGLVERAGKAALTSLLTSPGLVGLEVTQRASAEWFTTSDADPTRKAALRERLQLLGDRPLARIMSSDAHTDDAVGVDQTSRVLTRLRLDELSFHGVRMALQGHPQARCRLEVDLEPNYPRVTSATFSGGFLNGLTVEPSANLTCIIGSRGSGKTTALRAIRAALGGPVSDEEDGHPNMPDETRVRFVDALGSDREAVRRRYQDAVDARDGATPIELPVIDLEQNFGMEFLDEDPETCQASTDFLAQFLDTNEFDAKEAALTAQLAENGVLIKNTSSAKKELDKAGKERDELNASLTAAADQKLVQVAEYARILGAEGPLLRELEQAIKGLENVDFGLVPDIDAMADAMKVDLSERPAADFIVGVRKQLAAVADSAERAQASARKSIAEDAAPLLASFVTWGKRHEKWEKEIDARRAKLRKAGLSLQVDQLDKIRVRLGILEGDIRRLILAEASHKAALADGRSLLSELSRTRARRHAWRQLRSAELVKAVNRGATASVSLDWVAGGVVGAYGERLGQLFNLRSPRSERLAAAVKSSDMADIIWQQDATRLGALRDSAGPFITDPASALKPLLKWDTIFELQAFDVADRPDIRVRFPGDVRGRGRRLAELSLGQARSVLLGFLLASPGSVPLILDQPEDQLDGPFLASTVVRYLHAAKERRQVLVATHNPNVVVLGDAELVLPLVAAAGTGSVADGGSIDNSATRRKVVQLLEGGEPAFRERAFRYGFKLVDLPQ